MVPKCLINSKSFAVLVQEVATEGRVRKKEKMEAAIIVYCLEKV